MAESEEELKRLLMKVKEDSKKRWLKTQHSKNEDHGTRYYHFMANRWGKCGNSIRYKFLGSKINTDGDCNHKMKKCLLLGRIAMSNPESVLFIYLFIYLFLDSVLKSRHHFTNKCPYSQSYGFPSNHVWM